MSETKAADQAANAMCASVATEASLPTKRKFQEEEEAGSMSGSSDRKLAKVEVQTKRTAKAGKKSLVVKQHRLEQNRKAARNSRQRKKIMVEELQRSVVFFSRANSELKQQNEDLTRRLMQAQILVSAASQANVDANDDANKQVVKTETTAVNTTIQLDTPTVPSPDNPSQPNVEAGSSESSPLKQANAVATQAMFALQGYSAPAARAAMALNGNSASNGNSAEHKEGAATKTTTAPVTVTTTVATPKFETISMQPGATMQAMSNFQQAATAAMKAAIGQMQGIPGLDLSALDAPIGAPVTAGAADANGVATDAKAGATATASNEANTRNVQQAYTDTMTAFALQKAAVDAATAASLLHPPFRLPYLPPTNVDHNNTNAMK